VARNRIEVTVSNIQSQVRYRRAVSFSEYRKFQFNGPIPINQTSTDIPQFNFYEEKRDIAHRFFNHKGNHIQQFSRSGVTVSNCWSHPDQILLSPKKT
jgi:hypothetical protein